MMCHAASHSNEKSTAGTPAVGLRKPFAISNSGGFRLSMRRESPWSPPQALPLPTFSGRRQVRHYVPTTPVKLPAAAVLQRRGSGRLRPAEASVPPVTPRASPDDEDPPQLDLSPPLLAPQQERFRRVGSFPEEILIPDF
jgi:hypothetical protein